MAYDPEAGTTTTENTKPNTTTTSTPPKRTNMYGIIVVVALVLASAVVSVATVTSSIAASRRPSTLTRVLVNISGADVQISLDTTVAGNPQWHLIKRNIEGEKLFMHYVQSGGQKTTFKSAEALYMTTDRRNIVTSEEIVLDDTEHVLAALGTQYAGVKDLLLASTESGEAADDATDGEADVAEHKRFVEDGLYAKEGNPDNPSFGSATVAPPAPQRVGDPETASALDQSLDAEEAEEAEAQPALMIEPTDDEELHPEDELAEEIALNEDGSLPGFETTTWPDPEHEEVAEDFTAAADEVVVSTPGSDDDDVSAPGPDEDNASGASVDPMDAATDDDSRRRALASCTPGYVDLTRAPSQQSSTVGEFHSQRPLNSGRVSSDWARGTCSHTHNDQMAWWQVTLPAETNIEHVKVLGIKGFESRLSGFNLLVDGKQCASNVPVGRGEFKSVPCKATGRVLRLQLPRRSYLSICGFKVYAGCEATRPPLDSPTSAAFRNKLTTKAVAADSRWVTPSGQISSPRVGFSVSPRLCSAPVRAKCGSAPTGIKMCSATVSYRCPRPTWSNPFRWGTCTRRASVPCNFHWSRVCSPTRYLANWASSSLKTWCSDCHKAIASVCEPLTLSASFQPKVTLDRGKIFLEVAATVSLRLLHHSWPAVTHNFGVSTDIRQLPLINMCEVLSPVVKSISVGSGQGQQIKEVSSAIGSACDILYEFDPRFDLYTRAIIELADQVYAAGPNDANDVDPPSVQRAVRRIANGLTGVLTPEWDEHAGEAAGDSTRFIQLARTIGGLPAASSADEAGEWKKGEDGEATIMGAMDRWPDATRQMTQWGSERYSDSALVDLVFLSWGQQRIQRVKKDDRLAPATARYAVYLNALNEIEVMGGFDKSGADAYFDTSKRLVGIAYDGQLYRPEGPAGTDRQCTETFVRGQSRYRRDCSGYVRGWKHVKAAFRGALLGVVTLSEHLDFLHLTLANSIVTASVRDLPHTHPIRQLMAIIGYRTEAVNTNAAALLTPTKGLIHRAGPWTEHGLRQLHQLILNSDRGGYTMQPPPAAFAAKNVSELNLPLHQDGSEYYVEVKKFVKAYVDKYYQTNGACAADTPLQTWYNRVHSDNNLASWYDHGRVPALDCANLIEFISTAMWMVTAGHRHAGNLAAAAADPCFAPIAMREGQICGPPRTMMTQAVMFQATGFEQPKILEDYSRHFLDRQDKALWSTFQDGLTELGRRVAARNTNRKRPFRSFEVDHVEVSVGV